jgi:hypothetical protein
VCFHDEEVSIATNRRFLKYTNSRPKERDMWYQMRAPARLFEVDLGYQAEHHHPEVARTIELELTAVEHDIHLRPLWNAFTSAI